MSKKNAEVESGMHSVVSDAEAQARSAQDVISGNEFLKTSCGEAGNSAVDLYTGRLLYIVPLFQDQVGLTTNLIYNSDYRDETQQGTNLGNGWRLDALGYLSTDSNNGPVYIDGIGTKHLFHANRTRTSMQGTNQFNAQIGLSKNEERYFRAIVSSNSSTAYMTDEQYILTSSPGYSYIEMDDNIVCQ